MNKNRTEYMERILVVDDEQDICEILQFNLETEGYEVDTANSAEEALKLNLTEYDIILLDVMMADISGFQMARQLKQRPETANIPIIFITALDNENDIVKGLNLGADDYIAKPLSIREVKARVKAVLRRVHGDTYDDDLLSSRSILYETMQIDLDKKKVLIEGEEVQLTRLEFELLVMLIQNPSKVFSREQILEKIWPNDAIVMDRTVDVNITRVRKKIGKYGKCIKTRFGYGYTFEK